MKTMYRVQIESGDRAFTAYAGTSGDKARNAADHARAALIIGRGTARITIRENGVTDMVWAVQSGDASLIEIAGYAARVKAVTR